MDVFSEFLMLRKMAFNFTPGSVPFNPVFFGSRVGRVKKSLVIFSFISRLFLNIKKEKNKWVAKK